MAPKLALLVPPQATDTPAEPVKVEPYHREAASILAQYDVTPEHLLSHGPHMAGYAAAVAEMRSP
jgi:hypothetical protein